MRIAVDAMGGDHGPQVVTQGAVAAAREFDCQLVLVGDKVVLESCLSSLDLSGLAIGIYHASENIEMRESPTLALRRKKDSSIRVCFELIKKGEAQAMVSAGNSGAIVAAGIMVLKKMAGVDRPALALLLPAGADRTVFLDVGANVDCKPLHLVQFAIMGSAYAHVILGKEKPRVALLSNGQEETKGNEITREAHALLKKVEINYQGYVEGRDLLTGKVDVIVTDGFVGNVALKVSEGMVDAMTALIKSALSQDSPGQRLTEQPLQAFKRRFDYDEYGGAPLLGIDGVAVVSHGGASARAIKNAIGLAKRFAQEKVNDHLALALSRYGQWPHLVTTG